MEKYLKRSALLRAAILVVLFLLLLIPAWMVDSLVREREKRYRSVVEELRSTWGQSQTITGPVLVVPAVSRHLGNDGREHRSTSYLHIVPESLQVNAEVVPERRKRGLFEDVLYTAHLRLSGSIALAEGKSIVRDHQTVEWDRAVLQFGLSDLKGVRSQLTLRWNDRPGSMEPGSDSGDARTSIVQAAVPLTGSEQRAAFAMEVQLNGGGELQFVALGRTTDVTVKSAWPHPSFIGAFLPENRSLTDTGFSAAWRVLDINRPLAAAWFGAMPKTENATFGVRFHIPVNEYQQTSRTTKYSELFITLTLLAFFIADVLSRNPMHPVHNALIGFAVVLFYLLLLSLAEVMGFVAAYGVAAVSTLALVGMYTRAILRDTKLAAVLTGLLGLMQAFFFVLVRVEDYALLTGSIGLFALLAVLMYVTRKVDWFSPAEDSL
jgi:inner membrane protein